METVYLETTILSYLVSEPSRDLIVAGHQQITREWWTRRRPLFACSISQEVLDEISRGDPVQASRRLGIARELPQLPIKPPVDTLAAEFMIAGILPRNAASDAVHLAVAVVAGTDYMLTWNCRHLANAQLLKRIAAVCEARGFRMPTVCTPEELMGGDANV